MRRPLLLLLAEMHKLATRNGYRLLLSSDITSVELPILAHISVSPTFHVCLVKEPK